MPMPFIWVQDDFLIECLIFCCNNDLCVCKNELSHVESVWLERSIGLQLADATQLFFIICAQPIGIRFQSIIECH